MRKRIVALILAFVMIFSMATTAFAADSISTEAQALTDLGLLTGNSSAGVTPQYLAGDMDRFTAACMILKMMGVYDEALKYQPTSNFPDAYKLDWVEGRNILGYLKFHPEYGFTGVPGGNFAPNQSIDQDSVLKVVLENLGYKYNVDFTWRNVESFAADLGITVVGGRYTVDGLAKNVFSALKTEQKGSTKTLGEMLVDKKVIDKALAIKLGLINTSNLPLAVEDVSFINLRQVKVVYNKEVEGDDIVDKDYYTINDEKPADAEIMEDGVSVLLTTATEKKVNGKDEDISDIKNGSTNNTVTILAGVGLTSKVEYDKLKASDSEFPTIKAVTLAGPKKIKVRFSEPVRAKSNPFTLTNSDGKKISLNSTIEFSDNDMIGTITASSEVKEGDYVLSVSSTNSKYVEDWAGYRLVNQDVDFEAVEDTSTPTAEVVEVETKAVGKQQTVLTLKFNKDMKESGGKIANMRARLGYNASSAQSVPVVKDTDNNKDNQYTVTFDGILAPGTHSIFLVSTGSSSSSTAKDSWGNVFPDTEVQFEVAVDNTKPYVVSITPEDENKLVVLFSKDVTNAKFTVKDDNGKKVNFTSSGSDSKKKKITLTLKENFNGDYYTVEVKGAKDLSVYRNEMDADTVTVETKDKTNPYVKSATRINAREIRVAFSEEMNEDSATDKTNWAVAKVGVTTAPEISKVVMENDGRAVTVKLKSDFDFKNGADDTTYNTLQVANIKDLDGNRISDNKNGSGSLLVTLVIDETKSTLIQPSEAEIVGRNKIMLTYEGYVLDNVDQDAYDVKLYNSKDKTLETVTNPDVDVDTSNYDTKVTLDFSRYDVDKGFNVTSIRDENGKPMFSINASKTNTPEDENGIKLDTAFNVAYGSAETNAIKDFWTDSAGPVMVSAVANTKYADRITVHFSEPLYVASVNDDDFLLDDYNISRIAVINNDRDVVLYLKDDKFGPNEEITVSLNGTVRDKYDNDSETQDLDIKSKKENTRDITLQYNGNTIANNESIDVQNNVSAVTIETDKAAAQSLSVKENGVTSSNVKVDGTKIEITGLKPGDNKSYTVTVSEDGCYSNTYSFSIVVAKLNVTGVLAIQVQDGNAIVGKTLTADISNIKIGDTPLENVEYQWMSKTGDDYVAINGATKNTYLLTTEDVGKDIIVRVTITGSATVAETTVDSEKVTVGLAEPDVNITFTAPTSVSPVVEITGTVVTISVPAAENAADVKVNGLKAGQKIQLEEGTPANVRIDSNDNTLLHVSKVDAQGVTFTVKVTEAGHKDVSYTVTVKQDESKALSNFLTGSSTTMYTVTGDVTLTNVTLGGAKTLQLNGGTITFKGTLNTRAVPATSTGITINGTGNVKFADGTTVTGNGTIISTLDTVAISVLGTGGAPGTIMDATINGHQVIANVTP